MRFIQSSRDPLRLPCPKRCVWRNSITGSATRSSPDVDHLRVLGRDEGGLTARSLTSVVGEAVTPAPVHPKAADAAPEKGSEQVRPWCVVGARPGRFHDVVPGDGAAGALLEHLPGHQRLVGRLFGPDPLLWRVRFARSLLSPNGPSDPGDPSTVRIAMHGFLRAADRWCQRWSQCWKTEI